MRRAFTLVEMLVVIMIMMMVMATLLPALAMMQKKADLYSANNVINVVHNVQRSYAMQFGFGGAVYGYTIRADNASAPGIQPWVISGGVVTRMTGVDVGKQMFWNSGGWVDITDNLRAVRSNALPGLNPNDNNARLWDGSTNKDLCIGFVPRAGFATVAYTIPGTDPPLSMGLLGSEAGANFRLRSSKQGYRDAFVMEIYKTGILSAYAP